MEHSLNTHPLSIFLVRKVREVPVLTQLEVWRECTLSQLAGHGALPLQGRSEVYCSIKLRFPLLFPLPLHIRLYLSHILSVLFLSLLPPLLSLSSPHLVLYVYVFSHFSHITLTQFKDSWHSNVRLMESVRVIKVVYQK